MDRRQQHRVSRQRRYSPCTPVLLPTPQVSRPRPQWCSSRTSLASSTSTCCAATRPPCGVCCPRSWRSMWWWLRGWSTTRRCPPPPRPVTAYHNRSPRPHHRCLSSGQPGVRDASVRHVRDPRQRCRVQVPRAVVRSRARGGRVVGGQCGRRVPADCERDDVERYLPPPRP